MKIEELRAMEVDGLIEKERQLRDDLLRFRLKLVTGELEDTSQIKKTRKTIAKIKTILKQKQKS